MRDEGSMTVHLIQRRQVQASGWVLLASALLMTTPVRADVLEIGDNGAAWIAGGPARITEQSAISEIVSATPSASQSLAVTVPTVTAGPFAWNVRIAQLAAKYDLSPALLEAVVWQESRWRHDAVSPAGARGLAQLMPETARELGVNPDDPHANLEGGARYLRQQLDSFGGNLEKALAAYNAGPGRVRQAGGVPQIRETRQYVAAILSRLAGTVR
jgi:soluble lytic murein transglycosylase-like protein